MSTEKTIAAVSLRHLTNGDNFWTILQPVLKSQGQAIAILPPVQQAGNHKENTFVILNVSNPSSFRSNLLQKGLDLVSSPLLRSKTIHEDELRGVLEFAHKRNRRLVDIGSGLILGAEELMEQAFPGVTKYLSAATPPVEKTIPAQNGHYYPDCPELRWSELADYIPSLLAGQCPPLQELKGIPYFSSGMQIGLLAKDVANPSPVARFDIHAAHFSDQQKKISDKVSRLTEGQYLRIVLTPSGKNIFIGDLQALSHKSKISLDAMGQPLPLPKIEDSPPARPENKVEDANQSSEQAPATPHDEPTVDQTAGSADISAALEKLQTRSVGWGYLKLKTAQLYEELQNDTGFRILFKDQKPVGIAVSDTLASRIEPPDCEKKVVRRMDIVDNSDEILDLLKKGIAIEVERYSKRQLTIYPAVKIPKALSDLVLEADQPTPGNDHPPLNMTPVPGKDPDITPQGKNNSSPATGSLLGNDFAISASFLIQVPADLSQRIAQRAGEAEILARVKELKKQLVNLNAIIDITWNKEKLSLSANPQLTSNADALAKYFNKQVKNTTASPQPEVKGVEWISAFEEAVRFDGVVVFKPSGKSLPVLITKDANFFPLIKKEFC